MSHNPISKDSPIFKTLIQKTEELLEQLGYVPVSSPTQSEKAQAEQAQKSDPPCYLKNHSPNFTPNLTPNLTPTHIAGGVVDIYGEPLKCDFLVYHPEKHPGWLGIIVKFLEANPTNNTEGDLEEEIFPYLVQSIAGNGMNFVLLVGGDGCSPEAKKWLEGECGDNLLGAFWWEEFEAWAIEKLSVANP